MLARSQPPQPAEAAVHPMTKDFDPLPILRRNAPWQNPDLGRLESVQFKYLLDTTRKFALPMLDYLDRLGATRRVVNTRYPRNSPSASE